MEKLLCVCLETLPTQRMESFDAEWARGSLVRSEPKVTGSSWRAGLGLPALAVSAPGEPRGPKDPDLGPGRARPGVSSRQTPVCPSDFLLGWPSRETIVGQPPAGLELLSVSSHKRLGQARRGAAFQTETWSCSTPHLHVQAVAPGSGFRARSQASSGFLACVSGFSIENTPTSPAIPFPGLGFSVWSRVPFPCPPRGTLALRGPAGRDQAPVPGRRRLWRGALGLNALSLYCCSEQPLPRERPAGGVTSPQPWPACVPGGERGRETP